MIFGIPLNQFLGLAVVGSAITALGSVLGIAVKETLLASWFERWKNRQAGKLAWDKYRIPFATAAVELLRRLQDIHERFPGDYLSLEVLSDTGTKFTTNDRSDPHYRHYKLVSTLYRFCAFWGWVELYRRDVLRLSETAANERCELESHLRDLRAALADGQLNQAQDLDAWTDRLIFREEQRCIGEQMVAGAKNGSPIMGYAEFAELVRRSERPKWLQVVLNFFLVPGRATKDFRAERMRRMIVELYFVALYLDQKNVPKDCCDLPRRFAAKQEPPGTRII